MYSEQKRETGSNRGILGIGRRFKLLKAAGAVLSGDRGFISIPAGEVITIRALVNQNVIAEASWRGDEVLLFTEDIRNAGIAKVSDRDAE